MNSTQLNEAIDSRKAEIEGYQNNINVFSRAVVKIGSDPDLAQYKAHLEQLHKEHIIEQKKSQIILAVLLDQLSELPV